MEEQRYQYRNKDLSSQRHRFSELHLRMRKLDTQEGGENGNRCFRTMVLETNTTHTMDSMATSKTILKRVKPKTSLESKITKQRFSSFAYIVRANSLETTLMFGMVSGRRRKGRQRTSWMDTTKVDTNLPMEELKEAVKDRKTWRMIIHKVTESRLQLNG